MKIELRSVIIFHPIDAIDYNLISWVQGSSETREFFKKTVMQLPKRPLGHLVHEENSTNEQQGQGYKSIQNEIDAPPSLFEHLRSRVISHPFISTGFALTVGAFGMMVKNRKNSLNMNYWGRWRVGFQSVTLVLVFYAMYAEERAYHGSPFPWDWVDEKKKFSFGLTRNVKEVPWTPPNAKVDASISEEKRE